MTVLLCSVFSILRYNEHRNILYLTWTGSSNPQLFRTGITRKRVYYTRAYSMYTSVYIARVFILQMCVYYTCVHIAHIHILYTCGCIARVDCRHITHLWIYCTFVVFRNTGSSCYTLCNIYKNIELKTYRPRMCESISRVIEMLTI